MKINDVAKLTGVSVRALHYYDEIGLIKPNKNVENGYRCYDVYDIEMLQQILFFRELDFKLDEIKKIITDPCYNKKDALRKQKQLLIKKRERTDKLIQLITNTIEGEDNMDFDAFDKTQIEELKSKYKDEVKSRWGTSEAFKQSEKRTALYNNSDWNLIHQKCNEILKEFADYIEKSPNSDEVMTLVRKWQNYISENFYACTDDILISLADMYKYDQRFKDNIDRNGEGTADFLAEAIYAYCSDTKVSGLK